jgi:hypothetical protein
MRIAQLGQSGFSRLTMAGLVPEGLKDCAGNAEV